MTDAMQRFTGKTACITGAGSGIGRSIALRFAGEGADVALCDVNEQSVQETASQVKALGRTAFACGCDVADLPALEDFAVQVMQRFAGVDVLINCAGIGETNVGYEDITPELWDRIFAVNVRGAFFLCQHMAKQMVAQGIKGRIINIGSVEGKTNRGGSIAYAASKRAIIGMTQGLAIQLSPYNITANVVCPGLIDTPIWHRADGDMGIEPGSTIKMVAESAIESRLLKIMRIGQPDDVAGMVAFLASDDAAYMTGQAVNVCGGLEFS